MFDDISLVLWDQSQAKGMTPYQRGSLTDTVYACLGAMEDWAYGVGFDDTPGSQQLACTPNSMLPFDKDDFLNKEKLQNVRTAVYLVESSNMKSPPRSSYGTDNDVFCQTCIGDGYIPRNIRLMYAFLDLVSPSIILDEPAILENRVVLSWKLNGCMSINKMTINIKTPSGQIQSTDLIKNGEKYVCNHDVITKQSLFTHSIPIV